MMPKFRGWNEGVLSEDLRSAGGGVLKKGSVVRYKKKKAIRDNDNFKLTEYEWHYLNEDNQNLIRTISRTIEGLEFIKESYLK